MVVFPHVVNQLSKHYEWNILSFSHGLVVSPFITEWIVIQSLDLVLGSCLCSTAVPVCGLLPCPNLYRQWVEGAQGWVRLTPLCLQIKFILHSLSEAQVSRRALKVQEGVTGVGVGVSIQTSQRAEAFEPREGTQKDEYPNLAFAVRTGKKCHDYNPGKKGIAWLFLPLSEVPGALLQDQGPREPRARCPHSI